MNKPKNYLLAVSGDCSAGAMSEHADVIPIEEHNYELVEANDGTTEYMSDNSIILKKIKSSYQDDVDLFLDKNISFSCVSNHRTITLSKTDLNSLNK